MVLASISALTASVLAYKDVEYAPIHPYGTLKGEGFVRMYNNEVLFKTSSTTTKPSPQIRNAIRITNIATSTKVYSNESRPYVEYDTDYLSYESPAFSYKPTYTSYSTNEVYGGDGKLINYVHTEITSSDL